MSAASAEAVSASPSWDHYRILSAAFTVRSFHEGFAEALRWHLAPFRRPGPDPHAYRVELVLEEDDSERPDPMYSIILADELRLQMSDPAIALNYAVWATHEVVPRRLRDFLFVHAGVVARGQDVLLLPAHMDHGKTTLVTALLQAGFSYMSDEMAPIDPVTGRIYPFERLLRLEEDALRFFPGLTDRLDDRRGLCAELRARFVRPEDVGAEVAGAGMPRWLVFPLPVWDGPPRLSPIPRGDAVLRLLENCFNRKVYAERSAVLLSRVAASAEAFVLEGGTPHDRAALLAARFLSS